MRRKVHAKQEQKTDDALVVVMICIMRVIACIQCCLIVVAVGKDLLAKPSINRRNVLAIVNTFLPDENHEAVIQCFETLSEQLENVKRELVNIMKKEVVYVRYGQHIVSIQTATRVWLDVAKARDDASRER